MVAKTTLDPTVRLVVLFVLAAGTAARAQDLVTPVRVGRAGHAGPPVATPAAQCIGRHRFEIAFEPHGPAPTSGALLASARAHNIPPRVVVARRAERTGPLARSFLRIDPGAGNLVLSALKQGEESPGVVVRSAMASWQRRAARSRCD